ncbi:MAG: DUF4339 domain-containing protein, partial [Muribaculaceae bacterium]|nr:DUF4339 domain-containing protein [Muribaculaceae bacterium]
MEIWIHINDCQEGPFAIDDLPVDRIAPDTPVWHDGLPDWVYAKDVPALAHLFTDPADISDIDPAPSDNSDSSDNSDIASPAEQELPRQQPWEPLPPRQPQYPPQQQYCPPQQQYYP